MDGADVAAAPAGERVLLRVEDDLRRSRLTVFFRLLLAIPHFVWFALWSIVVVFAAIANWVGTLAVGRPPAALHQFLSAYVRYGTHLGAYVYLAANPYPGFTGAPGSYPIDVVIPARAPQRRWTTLLRLILALPALVVSAFLGGSAPVARGGTSGRGGQIVVPSVGGGALGGVSAFFGWFASLARGRMPRGLRDAVAYGLGYGAQVRAYVLVLTERYPNADPQFVLADVAPPPPHPVSITVSDDLRRSRVTVFFRALLTIPHFFWLTLWGIAAWLAAIASWFATLFAGRSPDALHRFLAAYLRYTTHVYAFLFLVANPFPGFVGRAGSYPVDLEIAPPARQNRWITGFRILLSFPAYVLNAVLTYALFAVAFLVWWASLVTGRAPRGLRNLAAYAIRYGAQVTAYWLLLTDRYPHTSPLEGRAIAEEPPLATVL